MARNYYLVLGVESDAAPDEIRSAFRRLALRYHPDRGDDADARLFREAAEAYGVLSDPGTRARYDRRLDRGLRATPVTVEPTPVREPEPLIPEIVVFRGRPEPMRPTFPAFIGIVDRIYELADALSIGGLAFTSFALRSSFRRRRWTWYGVEP